MVFWYPYAMKNKALIVAHRIAHTIAFAIVALIVILAAIYALDQL
jgi:hypothetical protein